MLSGDKGGGEEGPAAGRTGQDGEAQGTVCQGAVPVQGCARSSQPLAPNSKFGAPSRGRCSPVNPW